MLKLEWMVKQIKKVKKEFKKLIYFDENSATGSMSILWTKI